MGKNSILKDDSIVGSPQIQIVTLAILMFLFWLALSGTLKFKFVMYGIVTSIVVAWVTYPLLLVESENSKQKYYILGFSPIKFIGYTCWLMKELVLANVDVVKATVRPELRIDPKVISFFYKTDNPIAMVVLANSITLTPGTVTMNVTTEGIYEIHALTKGSAEGLLAGTMAQKVSDLFGEKNPFIVLKGE